MKHWSKEIAIKEYQKIRKEHGDKAKSSKWMKKNGYVGLCSYVRKAFDSWNSFKKQAGFDEDPLYESWTKEIAIKEYQKIRELHGDKAKSSFWMKKNGYRGLCSYVVRAFDSWNSFKQQAGFDEKPLWNKWTKEIAIKEYQKIRREHGDKAKSSSWMEKNGYGGLCYYVRNAFDSWNSFKKQAGFNEDPLNISWSKEIAIKEYKKIRKEHGDKAKSSFWMLRNGYSGLCSYFRTSFCGWQKFLDFYNYSYTMTENDLRIS